MITHDISAPANGDAAFLLPESGKTGFWEKFRQTKAYDLFAAAPLILLYGSSAVRQLPALGEKIGSARVSDLDLHFIISRLAELGGFVLVVTILIFLLIREPAKARAKGLVPAIVAIAGTSFAVTVVWLPQITLGFTFSVISLLLIIVGVSFASYTMFYLGRSFSIMPQARTLVTSGPYAIVRHPLYLGEGLAIVGMSMQYFSPLAAVIVAMQFAFQIQRMKNEEKLLMRQFPEYRDYMTRTARVVPGVY